jgi:hypothetical protein
MYNSGNCSSSIGGIIMRIAYFTDTYLPQVNGVTNTLDKLGTYLTENDIE